MRLPGNRARVERVLRVVGLTALGLWIINAARAHLTRRDVVAESSLADALPRWTRAERMDSVHVQLDTVPDAASSAWLAALRGAGLGVSWAADAIPAVALEAFPATDPAGGVFVLASAPPQTSRIVSDALGPLDTLRGARTPAIRLASVEGGITLTSGRQPARAEVAPRAAPKRVFVSGAAGWEAKFVVAALEESGWTVDAHLFVAPDRDVWQGVSNQRPAIDTARYAAVVLLDSASADRARGVEQFARAGGGLVLGGDASLARNVAAIVAWRVSAPEGKREIAPLGTLPGDTVWRGLSRVTLDTVADRRAVALERRAGKPVVAARRYFAGRVVGVAYDQTWRWRMAGGDTSQAEHRDWWSRIVASVATRPASSAGDSIRTGAAPLASLYDALGAPSQPSRVAPGWLSPAIVSNVLGLLFFAALLAEWLSRRARGAR